ncbi:AI-2E family transporter [Cryobacterium roopkundense]|uniref:Putative PurR-regulated permease PerM n=1 Tax=Cryobacterium roopkundense TaxID=1001240 RepID=A0A7W9E427_9MICO|nr:AI-2E family transporter [Cryobacterium roopkundense]MBB5640525.1 putative PurR-regulated permease PerM [Cryobacterium roopkundense]
MTASDTSKTSLNTLLTDRIGWLGLRSGQVLLAIVLASTVVWGLVQLQLVVIPVLTALIIASAASPVMRFLKGRGLSSLAATWITLLVGIVIFGTVSTLIVLAVENQVDELVVAAADGIETLQGFLINGPLPIEQEQIDSAIDGVVGFLTSSQFSSGALAGVSVAGQLATGGVLAIVILFFFLKDGPKIWEFFISPLKDERRARGERVGSTTVRVLGGYVRGTAIVAFVDAAAIGIGLMILQVPLALPLAALVFVGAFIPLVGATATGILAALVALVFNGWVVALIVLAIVVAVNQLEGTFLQPVVMGNSLKLHPLVILVALTAGTVLGQITGAVLAVPIAAVAWAIAKIWNAQGDPDRRPTTPPSAEVGASVARKAPSKPPRARAQRKVLLR